MTSLNIGDRTAPWPDEDWSEIEALLASPGASIASPSRAVRPIAIPSVIQTPAPRSRRLAVGLAALVVLGGGGATALSLARQPACRGGACEAQVAAIPASKVAPAPPAQIAEAEPRDAAPRQMRQGRSAAEAPLAQGGVPPQAQNRKTKVSTRHPTFVAPSPPFRPHDFGRVAGRMAARAPSRRIDAPRGPAVAVGFRPRFAAARLPPAAHPPLPRRPQQHLAGAPRLQRVWISANEYILVPGR